MNLLNIKVGDSYKNYKELCAVLEEKVKTGNSKKSQIKEWERYFDYEIEGHKYIIKMIYDLPLEKIENRGGARHILLHSNRMDHVLMYILNEQKTEGELFLPIHSLLKELNMINVNYSFANINRQKASKYLNIEKAIVEEFFDTTTKTFRNNIESMLNRLESKVLIFWSKVKTVCVAEVLTAFNELDNVKARADISIDEYDNEVVTLSPVVNVIREFRPATDEEIELILRIEGEVMDQLNCKNKQELIIKDKWKQFIKAVNDELFDKTNILFYYDSYKIVRNIDRLAREVEKLENFLNDEVANTINKVMLNIDVQNQLSINMERRSNSAIQKVVFGDTNTRTELRTKENYLDNGTSMINTFINMGYPDIRNEMKKTKFK